MSKWQPSKNGAGQSTYQKSSCKKGRASYLGERAIDHIDTGSALFFETLLTTILL